MWPCFVPCLRYLTLAQAQAKALKLDWSDPANKPFKPHIIGTKVLADYPIEDVVPYIDWNPFFQVWQLRGRYPNRGYPKIFNDPTVGVEAKKLFEEAQAMLKVRGLGCGTARSHLRAHARGTIDNRQLQASHGMRPSEYPVW